MLQLLEDTLHDIRQAARISVQHPTFAAAAILSLALGIGANTAVFSVVHAALLNPLPFPEPDRLVAIHGRSPTATTFSVSFPNFLDWRDRVRAFEDLAAWRIDMFTLSGQPQAERVIGGHVSASYFSILRVRPLLGRTFDRREDQPGGPPVVLLGEGLWRRRFAATPSIVGQPVMLNGKSHTVIRPSRAGAIRSSSLERSPQLRSSYRPSVSTVSRRT